MSGLSKYFDLMKEGKICECVSGDCCGNQCIFFGTGRECSDNCLNLNCSNRCVQQSKFPSHTVRVSRNDKSLYLAANEYIKSGTVVAPYFGIVMLQVDFNYIMDTTMMATAKPVCTKYINLNEHFVVESGDVGSAATFARNSCDPNCQLKNIYLPNGECIPVLVATRDISCDEEITRDYAFHLDATRYKERTECGCGSKNCRLFINTERTYDLKSSLGHSLLASHPVKRVFNNSLDRYTCRFDTELHTAVFVPSHACQSCKQLTKPPTSKSGVLLCVDCNVYLCHDCFFGRWHSKLNTNSMTVMHPSTGKSLCMSSTNDTNEFCQLVCNESLRSISQRDELCPQRFDDNIHAKVFINVDHQRHRCVVCNDISRVTRCVQCMADVCEYCWYYWHPNMNSVITMNNPKEKTKRGSDTSNKDHSAKKKRNGYNPGWGMI